jgi:hypothetical protein
MVFGGNQKAMSRRIETYGSIRDGQLRISYRDRFIDALKQMPDCRVRLSVEKLYNRRSTNQNAYYHGVICYEFCEGYYAMTGDRIEADNAHELLKFRCNGKDIPHPETGEVLRVPQTTTSLTTVEFEEYLDRCRAFILEWFGVTVPMPNEQTELALEKNLQ